jgi:hypothetical protein
MQLDWPDQLYFHKPGRRNLGFIVDTLPAANQLPDYQPHQTGGTVGPHSMFTLQRGWQSLNIIFFKIDEFGAP